MIKVRIYTVPLLGEICQFILKVDYTSDLKIPCRDASMSDEIKTELANQRFKKDLGMEDMVKLLEDAKRAIEGGNKNKAIADVEDVIKKIKELKIFELQED